MTISEFIKSLQDLQKEKGDIYVPSSAIKAVYTPLYSKNYKGEIELSYDYVKSVDNLFEYLVSELEIKPTEQVKKAYRKAEESHHSSGQVDFTDDKLYDFSFENTHAKDAGGWNSKFIDSDLKADYKKEFDLYYKQMLDLINANYDFKLVDFMREMSRFFTMVSARSKFNETPFELREKFYEYLTDKFNL